MTGNTLRPSGTWLIPRATISCAARPESGSPSSRTSPDAGHTSPDTVASVVVLPAPFAPSRATTSPDPTRRLTPRSAVTEP